MFCGIMIAVCLVGAWFAGKWLLAEYHRKNAVRQLEIWEERGFVLRGEFEAALDEIDKAVSLNEMKADFHHARGRILEQGLNVANPGNPDLGTEEQLLQNRLRAEQLRREALQSYRDANTTRPAWGQTWIRLANLKGQLGEFDDEFADTYSKANLYSASLGELQESLTFLAVRYFDEIQTIDSLQNIQLTHLVTMLDSGRARQTIDLLNTFGHLKTLCNLLKEKAVSIDGMVMQACEQALAEESDLYGPSLTR